ncbi:hypothetical protein SN35N_0572 [Lactiplantibacillus plantarum]|nr:hypothetical protein SN35N_0572 [Lactiplantibacillus plantarum]BEI52790.1 hypothetical protein AWA2045_09210 [Lactiplantibacillus plantarum]
MEFLKLIDTKTKIVFKIIIVFTQRIMNKLAYVGPTIDLNNDVVQG